MTNRFHEFIDELTKKWDLQSIEDLKELYWECNDRLDQIYISASISFLTNSTIESVEELLKKES